MSQQVFTYDQEIKLESGQTLAAFHLAYHTYGALNESKDNVVWIFHALTANSDAADWWPGIVGKGKLFDPEHHFIICVNKPGSPYGSISPLSTDPVSGKPYRLNFPVFNIRDIIRCFQHLKNHLGIQKVMLGIGGSTGGMQLLEWAIMEPELFAHIVPIATSAELSPWGIAFNASQRMAIEADPSWNSDQPGAGAGGLAAARSVALLSYRHYRGYGITQPRNRPVSHDNPNVAYAADSYQRYQGQKLVNRFDAQCYYRLTQAMDSHDISIGRGSSIAALKIITAKTMVIGIESDVLYPVEEQEFLAENIPGAQFMHLYSDFGHDGFLLEFDQIEEGMRKFWKDREEH